MKFAGILALALLPLAIPAQQQEFDLKVERVRPLRNQPGDLHIDAQGLAFRSQDGKSNVTVKMQDLRQVSVADPRGLRFETYDVEKWKPIERREYTFRASPDAPLDSLAQFLAPKVHRAVVGHYWQGAQFEAPAYHRRAFGGSNGTGLAIRARIPLTIADSAQPGCKREDRTSNVYIP